LRFEPKKQLRASVVLDAYKRQVEGMNDEELNFADRERKQKVLQLLKTASDVKVVDAGVLAKIYDLYSYKI